jgi:hypothetical protein
MCRRRRYLCYFYRMRGTTREKIGVVASKLEECDRDLRALPQSPTTFQALARLKETSFFVRLLHAKTPDAEPRRRAPKSSGGSLPDWPLARR